MSYLIAIDIGIKNLGICVFDFVTSQIVYWENVSLTEGRFISSNNVRYVVEFCEKYSRFFNGCAYLVVERQMRSNMRILEASFHALYYGRCTIVAPRAVKMHYNISAGNYKGNKQLAVDWVSQFTLNNSALFNGDVEASYFKSRKKDDMADALLLVLYYLDTYSNQLG